VSIFFVIRSSAGGRCRYVAFNVSLE